MRRRQPVLLPVSRSGSQGSPVEPLVLVDHFQRVGSPQEQRLCYDAYRRAHFDLCGGINLRDVR